jgi:hypothetical protein
MSPIRARQETVDSSESRKLERRVKSSYNLCPSTESRTPAMSHALDGRSDVSLDIMKHQVTD